MKNIARSLQKYQSSSAAKKRQYLAKFEEKMIYRTTKTENPQTTLKMVKVVLNKIKKR